MLLIQEEPQSHPLKLALKFRLIPTLFFQGLVLARRDPRVLADLPTGAAVCISVGLFQGEGHSVGGVGDR